MGEHRTAAGAAVARVVVLQASVGGHWAQPGRGLRAEPGRSDTARALARLGGEVEILLAEDVRGCAELAGRPETDLVLLDRCERSVVAAFFECSFPSSRSPVVVVIAGDAPESAALDAFRRGAADCVRFGEDYSEALPLVAMEQIRRWRQVRERDATRTRIEWLENLNEAIVTEIPVALVVVDRNRRVVEVNPEFEKTFGHSAASARGLPAGEILPSDLIQSGDLTKFFPPRGPGDNPAPCLARTLDPAGEERVFDIRSQSLDREGHVLLAFSNVTETELLNRRVGELERFNEYVVESINSALMVIDLSGKISYANPTAARILGRDEGDLRGESVERFFGSPDGTSSLVARALEEGVHSKGSELMLGLDGGRAIPIGISCTPLLDNQGGIRGAVAIFQDLTEIKELQRQALQQEKMASIGQLAAGIAHEINNPVGFIHANLAQMAEYLGDLSGFLDQVGDLQQAISSGVECAVTEASAALEEMASRIDVDYVRKDFASALRESLEGSERIRHIVSDLREFSHRGGVETTLADINQCVDSTANIVWTMMKHSVELEKDYLDLPALRCHPMQLKQVFMNLLVNAYQSIEEALADSPEEVGTIGIATRERDNGIEIRISDTGSGIPAEDLQRIFDPFYTTKDVGVGTGLGLATSYGIVKQHGGEIEVTSEPGQGASFAVWLPLGPEKASGGGEGVEKRSD